MNDFRVEIKLDDSVISDRPCGTRAVADAEIKRYQDQYGHRVHGEITRNSVTVFNLSTEEEISFDKDTCPAYACAYAYYTNANQSSWFHEMTRKAFDWTQNVVTGKYSYNKEDWSVLI
jgi:hypothetical protein